MYDKKDFVFDVAEAVQQLHRAAAPDCDEFMEGARLVFDVCGWAYLYCYASRYGGGGPAHGRERGRRCGSVPPLACRCGKAGQADRGRAGSRPGGCAGNNNHHLPERGGGRKWGALTGSTAPPWGMYSRH